MKSLFIVNDFPPILGGQSMYLYNLCRAFPKDKILVLAPYWHGCQVFDQQQTFPIIRKQYLFPIPLLEKMLKIIIPLIHALRIVKKGKITHIHCAHVLSTGVVGLIFKKIGKTPYTVYTYSADILEYQKYFLIKKVLVSVLSNADRVIAISNYNKEKLLEIGVPLEKIMIIKPKIDFEEFSRRIQTDDLTAQYGLRDRKIILSVNRLVDRKGNDAMIEALVKIKQKISNVLYVIVGSGPSDKNLKGLVEKYNLNENVLFVGSTSRENVLKFYRICDVFVMLSREIKEKGDAEGFGIVFLEANACGKPVIGGNSGGIPDAIVNGETGLLVDPLDIDQISDAVSKILTDPEYAQKLGENGRQRAECQFDWKKGIKEIDQLDLLT